MTWFENWERMMKTHVQAHINYLLADQTCRHCLSGFWCPHHGENPELDDISEIKAYGIGGAP